MASILDLNLDSVPELGTMPTGSEAQLEITSCRLKEVGEAGYPQLLFSCKNLESTDETEYDTVFHTLWLPSELDKTSAASNQKRRDIRDFCSAVGINTDRLVDYVSEASNQLHGGEEVSNLEDAIGKIFYAVLKEEEYEGRLKNVIKKVVKGA